MTNIFIGIIGLLLLVAGIASFLDGETGQGWHLTILGGAIIVILIVELVNYYG